MNENPWHHLPDEPPFLLPEDKDKVLAFNDKARQKAHRKHVLNLDFIPEPFVGSPDARLVLLGNNPGVADPPEGSSFRLTSPFQNRMRDNLLHRLSDQFPFLYFDPGIIPPAKMWWEHKLRKVFELIDDNSGVAKSVLARGILAVEFFPYASNRFGHGKLRLFSQEYSFGLVREAVKRGAVIVVTRGEKRWLKAVPELASSDCRLVRLNQVQRAPISRNNCRDGGWSLIQEVIRKIKATGGQSDSQ
jgi:hypothetical protein